MERMHVHDDLTGDELVESRRVTMLLNISGGNQEEFTLDFDPKTLDALLSAFRDHEYAPLRSIFTGEPKAEQKTTAKPKVSDSEPTAKDINAWLKANGRPVPRGKPSRETRDEYLKAQKA